MDHVQPIKGSDKSTPIDVLLLQEVTYLFKHETVYFCVPFGNMLGHIVCKEGVSVDPAKVAMILNMTLPMSDKRLWSTLGHTGYYCQFIRNYERITAPLEKLLKKYEAFSWNPECDQDFETLK